MGAIECSPPEGGVASRDRPIGEWSTGYESGFCDYVNGWEGYCYTGLKPAPAAGEGGAGGASAAGGEGGVGAGDEEAASFAIVTSPVHSGRRAAAFTLRTDLRGEQSRCFVEGELLPDARYGAWFYLPANVQPVVGNWNLFHFEGFVGDTRHALWDVSLGSTDTEPLSLYVRDFLEGPTVTKRGNELIPVPIATWFHVEFRFRRAADETGTVALFQDGQLLWTERNRITDDSDKAQWYVGNFADNLPLEASTLYVDDVTIRPSP